MALYVGSSKKYVALGSIPVLVATWEVLTGIAVTTPPTKTEYSPGEVFDPTGMVVTATYGNGTTKEITNYKIINGNQLSADMTTVTISYTENGKTVTTSYEVEIASGKVILEVEKITSDTYAGGTTYESELFILLDIYPKTNGTVKVSYGGLTKTITDTSGAAEPNAQQVFFGTFNGVSDSVGTPTSGILTIDGDCAGFGLGNFNKAASKGSSVLVCNCIIKILSFGMVTDIPVNAFNSVMRVSGYNGLIGELIIPSTIKSIGNNAFCACMNLTSVTIQDGLNRIGNGVFMACNNLKTLNMLGADPPEMTIYTNSDGTLSYNNFGDVGSTCFLEQIIVPKGCGNAYKTAAGWSTYADYIVEAS